MVEGGRSPHPHIPRTSENALAAAAIVESISTHGLMGDVRQWGGAHGIPLSPQQQGIFDLRQSNYDKTIPSGERQGQSFRFRLRDDGSVVAYPMDPEDYRARLGEERRFFWNELWVSPQGMVTLMRREVLLGGSNGSIETSVSMARFTSDESLRKIIALGDIVMRGVRMRSLKGHGKLYTEKEYREIYEKAYAPETSRR